MRVAISHAAWGPGRPESLARLLSQLGKEADVSVFSSKRPEPVVVWSRRLWEFVEAQKEPVLCVQDDVTVHPQILEACGVLTRFVSDEILCLHMQSPDAIKVAKEGHHWCRIYWLSAPCYILPPPIATELLDFWSKNMDKLGCLNEDDIAVIWAWTKQKPFLTVLPALAYHDPNVPSTLGYDDHPNRVPSVPWVEKDNVVDPGFWHRPPRSPMWVPAGPVEYLDRVRKAIAGEGLCSCCSNGEAVVKFPRGTRVCHECAKKITLATIGRIL